MWAEAFANLPIAFWWSEMTCEDVMYSGHTAGGTIATLFMWSYGKKAPWFHGTITWNWYSILTDIIAIVWLFMGWYVICASHFHYTVDVTVGALLTFTVFNGYHSIIKTVHFADVHPLKGEVIGRFIRWFEAHSVDLKLWQELAERSLRPNAAQASFRLSPSNSVVESDARCPVRRSRSMPVTPSTAELGAPLARSMEATA